MYIVQSYPVAVMFCIITMLCWGSWGNTQKLAAKSWRYELFYWDYVIGIVLLSVILGFTLGSFGEHGRSFTTDLVQADSKNIWSAILGGVVFNAGNILLSAAVSLLCFRTRCTAGSSFLGSFYLERIQRRIQISKLVIGRNVPALYCRAGINHYFRWKLEVCQLGTS